MFVNLVAHGEFEPVPAALFRPGVKRGCHLDVGKLLPLRQKLRIWFAYSWPCVDKINAEGGSFAPAARQCACLGVSVQVAQSAAGHTRGCAASVLAADAGPRFAPAHLKLPTCLTCARTKASKCPGHLWRLEPYFQCSVLSLVQVLALGVRGRVRCLSRVLGVDLLPQLPDLLCGQRVDFHVSVLQWLIMQDMRYNFGSLGF